MFFKREKYILLSILVLAFSLRFINLTIGFPILYISNDEAIFHMSALNMVANKTIFSIDHYGPLGSYFQIPFIGLSVLLLFLFGEIKSFSSLNTLIFTNEGYFLFATRVVSAMFGTLAVIAAYKVSREIFNNSSSALWSAFFLAASFNMVHISHQGRPWTGAIFFSILSIFFILKALKNKGKNFIFLLTSLLCSAFSFGFHPVAGMTIIPITIYIFLFREKFMFKQILIASSVWLAAIILFIFLSLGINFFSILDFTSQESLRTGLFKIPENVNNINEFFWFLLYKNDFLVIIKYLVYSDFLIVLFFLSLPFLKMQEKRITYPLFIFIIFNFLMSTFLFVPLLRHMLISIALMCILAGGTVNNLVYKIKWKLVLAVIVIFVSSFNSVQWNVVNTREATFTSVRRWLALNVDKTTPIGSTVRRFFDYVPVKIAAEPIQEFKPLYYKKATDIVGDKYLDNVRNVIYLSEFGLRDKKADFIKGQEVYSVAYVVDSYDRKENSLFFAYPEKFEVAARFGPANKEYSEIPNILADPGLIYNVKNNFPLFSVDRPGPYFDVLKVNN